VARFTNTTTNSVGVNGNQTVPGNTNDVAGILFSGNGTVTVSNSSTANNVTNNNAALRVFGWVEGGQTNLIVNSSTSGHLLITNNGNNAAQLQFQLASGGVINVSNSGARVSLLSRIIEDSGETNTITKTGAGTLIIGGGDVNTWGGGVVLNAGVLQLNKASALGSVSGRGLTVNGGSLDNGSGGAITLSNYAQTWGGNFTFIGTTNLNLGAGDVDLTGTRTVTVTANALTVGGAITNTGGITKAGAGTLILNGANTYSGTTTLSAGTLALGNVNALQNSLLDTGSLGSQVLTFTVGGNNTYNIGGLSGSDDIALSANRMSVGANNADSSYAGALSGTGGLNKVGAGTLTLAGANTYNGGTLVSAGRIIGDTRSLQGTITNNAAVTFSQTTNGTYGSVLSGTGGTVRKTGSGTVTFSQNNTYTGATTVSEGRLVVNGSQGSSAVTVESGASLGGSGTVGGLTVSGLLAPGNSIGTLSAGNTTFNGGGSFELEIFDWVNTAGTGWDLLAITGDLTLNNTSGSPFTINLVSLANSTTPGLSTDWNANASFTNTFISYSGSLLGNSFASNLFTVNTNGFQNTVNGTFSITNVTGGLALLYTTAFVPSTDYVWSTTDGLWSVGANWDGSSAPTNGSALIFAGASGGVSTNDSQVNNVASVTFSNTAGSYTIEGSAFTNGVIGIVNNSSSAQTINNDITLGGIQSFNAASGDLTFGGAIDNNGNLFTVTGSSNTTLDGVVSGNGGLTKGGNGSLTLGGNNTYTGALSANGGTVLVNGTQATTTVNVSGGTLRLGGNNVLADGATLALSTGTVDFGGFSDTITTFNQSGGVSTNGTITATTYGLSGGTVGGTLGAGTANVTGGVTLSGNINSTLNVNSGGTLTLASADRIGDSSVVTVDAGNLATANFNDTVGSLVLTNIGSITGSGTITAATYTLNGGTVSANLGLGTATSTAGTTTLNGTLTGDLAVSGGTLTLGAADRIGGSSAVTVSSGTLSFGGFSGSVGSFSLSGGIFTNGTVTSSTYALSGGTVGGTLGAGTANVTGGVTLSGVIDSTLNINTGGTLTLTAVDRINNSSAVTVDAGTLATATFNDTVGSLLLTNNGSLTGSGTITASTYTLNGGTVIANLGAGTANVSTGTTTLNGTFAVTTLNIDGGTLALGAPGRIDNAAVVNLSSGVLDMGTFVDGVGTFNMTGGSVNGGVGSSLIATGGLNLQAGTVNANIGNSAVGISNGTTTINGTVGGAVTVSSGTANLNGALNSSLTASGGTVNLNTNIAGSVTVSGGTVNLASADLIGNSSAVSVSSGDLNLNGNDSVGAVALTGGTIGGSGTLTGTSYAVQGGTISTTIGGSGSMTKTGAGTTTLSANNSGFSGAVAVNAGSLLATTSGALGTGAVTVTNGSTLAGNGVTLANDFTIGTAGGFGSTTALQSWDFTGFSNNATLGSTFTNTSLATTVSLNLLTRGAGAAASTANNSFRTTGFQNNGISTNNTDYFEWKVASGTTNLSIRTLDARFNGTGTFVQSPGVTNQFAWSTNGTNFNLISTPFNITGTNVAMSQIDLTGIAALQDLATNTTVTFRFYASGQTTTGGYGFFSPGAGTNGLSLGGAFFQAGGSGSGTLGISEAGSATFSGNVVNNSAATLTAASGGTATFSGVISGLGSVTKTGDGTVTLSGDNTYSGGTTNSAGVLSIGAGGTSGSISGNVVNNATLQFNRSDSLNYAGAVSGTGSLTKLGAGTTTLSGAFANTYTGMTTVSAGTLELSKSADVNAIAGDITVNSGAILLLSSSGNVANSSAVTLSGGTITRGSGVNEVFGSLNLTTGSFLDFGTGATGSMTFGTYEENATPSALLTLNNFIPGNSFTFSNALFAADGSNIGSYFTFGAGFVNSSIINNGGNSFTITAIPEPSTYAAAIALLGLMLWPSRKRIVRDAKKIFGFTPPMRDRLAARGKA
jgi:autotransporter-associated beta strand protein